MSRTYPYDNWASIFIIDTISEFGLGGSYPGNGFAVAPLYVSNDNIGIVYRRTSKDPLLQTPVLHTDAATSDGYFRGPGNQIDTVSPLFILNDNLGRKANFNIEKLQELFSDIERPNEDSRKVYPEDIIDYIYASLHSPSYRKKYKEFLKTDFPRVPRPANWAEFWRLVELGCKLRNLHLMKSAINPLTSYPEQGDNVVEKIEKVNDKVYINSYQYFGGIPDSAWNFYIGGYQPAQKWLKDRKGRKLSTDDIIHYQRIITILTETDRIMNEIG